MRLYKKHTIELAKHCIREALRESGGRLTTTEISQSFELLKNFHGVRTLNLNQVGRLCRQMADHGDLERWSYGTGLYTGSSYRLVE